MPSPVTRAFEQLFPPRREEIQNPYRRSAVQAADAAMRFYQRPGVQEFLYGPTYPSVEPPPSPYGQITAQTPRKRIADIVNRAIPAPMHVALRAVGDPLEAVEGPLGPSKAIFMQSPKGKTLQYFTHRYNDVPRPYHSLRRRTFVKDPEVPAFERDALMQPGGDLAGAVEWEIPSPESKRIVADDVFQERVNFVPNKDYPVVHVEFAGAAGEGKIDPVYGGAAMQKFLKDVREELGDSLVVIDAYLVQDKLKGFKTPEAIEKGIAKGLGLGPEHVLFDPTSRQALFFAKRGRPVRVRKAVEELGGDPSMIRPVTQAEMEWSNVHSPLTSEEYADYENMLFEQHGGGYDPDDPIGFFDVPPEDIGDEYLKALEKAAEERLQFAINPRARKNR